MTAAIKTLGISVVV